MKNGRRWRIVSKAAQTDQHFSRIKKLCEQGTLTIVLTCLHVMKKKVNLLQTQTKLLNIKLKSLQGDTWELEHNVALCTCEL